MLNTYNKQNTRLDKQETERLTDSHTGRQTDRETDSHTGGLTGMQVHVGGQTAT